MPTRKMTPVVYRKPYVGSDALVAPLSTSSVACGDTFSS